MKFLISTVALAALALDWPSTTSALGGKLTGGSFGKVDNPNTIDALIQDQGRITLFHSRQLTGECGE